MDSSANGQKSRQEKCPARQNCQEPMLATRILRTRAVGLISAGAMLNSDMTAMYPDAPAWPTEEYKKAMTSTAKVSNARNSGVIL
jgi:hypothetical protein